MNKQIVAVIPVYSDLGDTTEIYYTDGTVLEQPVSILTVLKQIALANETHISILKKTQHDPKDRSLYKPLSFASDLLLYPLKVRNPRVPKDITLGYFNIYYACSLTKEDAQIYIQLPHNQRISIACRYKTALQHIRNAQLHQIKVLENSYPSFKNALYDPL